MVEYAGDFKNLAATDAQTAMTTPVQMDPEDPGQETAL